MRNLRQPCRSDSQEQILAGTEEKSFIHIWRTTRIIRKEEQCRDKAATFAPCRLYG